MNNIDKLMEILERRNVTQCVPQLGSTSITNDSISSELLAKKKKYFSNTKFCTGCGCGCHKSNVTCGA